MARAAQPSGRLPVERPEESTASRPRDSERVVGYFHASDNDYVPARAAGPALRCARRSLLQIQGDRIGVGADVTIRTQQEVVKVDLDRHPQDSRLTRCSKTGVLWA